MIKTITQIDYLEDVALVTVNNIPNSTKNVSFILNEIASRDVTVDMICQTALKNVCHDKTPPNSRGQSLILSSSRSRYTSAVS